MAFCAACGNALDDSAAFCNKCGQKTANAAAVVPAPAPGPVGGGYAQAPAGGGYPVAPVLAAAKPKKKTGIIIAVALVVVFAATVGIVLMMQSAQRQKDIDEINGVIRRYQNAQQRFDYTGLAGCYEPGALPNNQRVQFWSGFFGSVYKVGADILDFLDSIGISLPGIEIKVDVRDIEFSDGKTATVYTDSSVTFSFFGTTTSTERIPMTKIDGTWYISRSYIK
jgi:hypothetical protein